MTKKKRIILFVMGLISLSTLIISNFNSYKTVSSEDKSMRIGVVLPIEHQALNDIVAGFSETMKDYYGKKVIIKVKNALGDINIQKSIIEQFLAQKVDILVPVTTNTTLMALQLSPSKQTIIHLAANHLGNVPEEKKNL